MKYNCRQALIDALRSLSTFSIDGDAADPIGKWRYYAVKTCHHLCSVWQFSLHELLQTIDREPFDQILRASGSLLDARRFRHPNAERDWSDESVRSGPFWKNLRSLAAATLRVVESLPEPPPVMPLADDEVIVVSYDEDRIPNPPGPGDLAEDADGLRCVDRWWWSLREDLVLVCGRHGRVGPDDPSQPPQFWVVEDRMNGERYHYMEVYDPDVVTPGWLADVVDLLLGYPGWGIGVSSLEQAYLLIFGDRLMVTGDRLRTCRNADEVVESVRALVQRL